MDDIVRQHMIVRQNALNRACDLLIAEQTIANNSARIPLASIKNLAQELEAFIWELDKPDNRKLDPKTGKVVEKIQPDDIEV